MNFFFEKFINIKAIFNMLIIIYLGCQAVSIEKNEHIKIVKFKIEPIRFKGLYGMHEIY